MILFPNCKINLGLRVTGKRADGYHDLETVFYPIPLKDALEVVQCPAKQGHPDRFELTVTGTTIPGNISENLCTKAWKLIAGDFDIPAVKIHLHKAIPTGGGLGGGSSDGAHTLLLLNEELKLNIPEEKLLEYALRLGSDCPFFIHNKPCYATGRGEIMEAIDIDLHEYHFVVVNPGIHVSTAEAFQQIVPGKRYERTLREIMSDKIETWKEQLVNDFEGPIFGRHTSMRAIKDQLYDAGASYAAMTGTGSCIFGIFHNSKKTANLLAGKNYKVYILNQPN